MLRSLPAEKMFWIFAGFLLSVFLIYLALRSLNAPMKDVPEPPGLPIFRHIIESLRSSDQCGLILKWSRQVKDVGLFKTDVSRIYASGYLLYITWPEYVKQVLLDTKTFTKLKFFKEFVPLCGDGLLTSTGSSHAFQKKLLSKAFSHASLQEYLPIFNRHAHRLVKLWEAFVGPQGANIAVKKDFTNMAFDVFCEASISCSFDALHSGDKGICLQNQVDALRFGVWRLLFMAFPFLKHCKFIDFFQSMNTANEMLDEIVSSRRRAMEDGTLSSKEERDLLTLMMRAVDDESQEVMTDKLLKDNLFTLMLAGHETTGTSLPFMLYAFGLYPDVQDKARKEVLSVMQSSDSIDNGNISQLYYLTACIKEMFRMYSPVPTTNRRTTKETKIGEFTVPANTEVAISFSTMSRRKDLFPDPDSFNPDRFLEGTPKPWSFTPFGCGPNSCIGQTFAMMEMKVILSHLLRSFRFSVDQEYQTFDTAIIVTVQTNPPITIRVTPL